MKTLKEVIKDNPKKERVIKAVINKIGVNSVQDVVNHGANGGFSGFAYYHETYSFAMRYRQEIKTWLTDLANEMEVEVTEMIKNFGDFKNNPLDNEDLQEIYNYMGNGKCEQSRITNVFAWFALEEVCQLFVN